MTSILTILVLTLVVLWFGAGLLVRLGRATVLVDPSRVRARYQDERRARRAVRYPTEDVPVAVAPPADPEDEDPDVAIPGGEG